jgi:secreted Zn-dependent insulinase-like peptidase
MLWEQLAEAEKRERILRQELVLTQQGLSTCEKVVEKQRDHINKLDTEKVRLQNFKQNKGRRLDELEHKVAQYEMFEKINVEKLIAVLDKQDKELTSLRASSVGV